jgi:energy-coupling factor transporter ATP-binding protein EcfA2
LIQHIEIKGFKSLADVKLNLGNFNLFIGTNASGKSNFFDALRVLQGIGYGFTVDEILNGKPKSANSEAWEPIRGGSTKADFVDPRGATRLLQAVGLQQEPTITLSVDVKSADDVEGVRDSQVIHYSVGVSSRSGSVRSEKLRIGATDLYDSSPIDNSPSLPSFRVRYYPGQRGKQPHKAYEKARPVLHQMLRDFSVIKSHKAVIERCIRALSNTQRIDPIPAILREYSKAQIVRRMGEHGENFAALVNAILDDPKARSEYLSWLKQLTPLEFEDVKILRGALDEPLFALAEKGEDYPAPILSDGTLRFAAITAAFFQPDMPDILTIEEIENGIHPTRLRLLVELLKSQSQLLNRQVMATTHSPVVLSWLKEEDYATTFFCARDEDSGASVIKPLTEVPDFMDLIHSKQPAGELFTEGWLEGSL